MSGRRSSTYPYLSLLFILSLLASSLVGGLAAPATVHAGSGPDGITCIALQPGPDAGKDSFIDQDHPDDRKGNDNELKVKTEADKAKRALLQFDLSSLPPTISVFESATLMLYVKDANGGDIDIRANVISADWNEAQVTWNDRDKDAALPWTDPGGDYSWWGSVTTVGDAKDTWVSWDLTDEVDTWYYLPHFNMGVILEADTTDPKAEKKFVSSDDGHAELRPTLVICYDDDAPPPPTCFYIQPGPAEGKDSYIDEDNPGDRKGNDNELKVKTEAAKAKRSLLQFDLSGLPDGEYPSSATLSLFVKDANGGDVDIRASVVEAEWNEDQVTWDHRDKAAALPWDEPGGDFDWWGTAVTTIGDQKNTWVSWNVLDEVDTWVVLPSFNMGVILEADTTDPKAEKKFVSSDDGHAELRPVLEVCYDDLPPQPVCEVLQPGPADGKDSYIKEDSPDDRKGNDNELRVKTELSKTNRSLLYFDVSGLPGGITIESATMSLYVKDASGGDVDIRAGVVEAAWTENQVTWNDRDRDAALPWDEPGGDFDWWGSAVTTVGDQKDIWVSWDILDEVDTWYYLPEFNQGIILEADTTDPKAEKKFRSSEDGHEAERPKLEVCYSGLETTAVSVADFRAEQRGSQAVLRWTTLDETGNQGFHVLRATESDGIYLMLTGEVIPSQSVGGQGASYRWADSSAAAGTAYWYQLQAMPDGERVGPVQAVRSVGRLYLPVMVRGR